MKVFHVGMGNSPAIAREFSKISAYNFLDWTQYMELGPGAKELLNRDILKYSAEIDPDLTFLHIQRPGVITEEVMQRLGGVVFNYTYDVAIPIPEWYYEIGRHITTTIFCDEPGVWDFKSKGIDAQFMHVGYDQKVFTAEGSRGNYGDIVFLGNHYSDDQKFDLTKMRLDMVTHLKNVYGDRFKVYGNGWPYEDGNLMYRESREAECYRSCKIAINISHFDLERYTSDRMFRIMGSGAFCLSKWYPGIENDFKDGEHLRVWRDFHELQTLIDYYLTHDEERINIAMRGRAYVEDNFTWEHITKNIIDMANVRLSKEYKSRVVRVQQQVFPKAADPTQQATPTPANLLPAEDPSVPPPSANDIPVAPPTIKAPGLSIPTPTVKKHVRSINEYFDKIYFINLDRRVDRLQSILFELDKNNIDAERFAAFDGSNLTDNRHINKWEHGCFMSHIALLRKVVENNYSRTLILEDDINFINNVQDYFVRNQQFIPDDWSMLYLGGNHLNHPTQINPIIARTTKTYTTGAYGISRNMAQAILSKVERTGANAQIDVLYSDFHRGGGCYTFSPKIAWQTPGFSDIQQGMQDYTGVIR